MNELLFALPVGLFFGCTLGLCVAPLWMMLALPIRMVDVCDAGSMKMCAAALSLGAFSGALSLPALLSLSILPGIIGLLIGGIFVGMLSSALLEALEVVPALFVRLRVTTSMRGAAIILMLGKTAGALLAGFLGY